MEHLKFARAYLTGAENWLIQVRKQDTTFYERQMFATMAEMLSHLEAQQETPASASQPTEQPAPSLSEATEPGTGTSDGWSISYSLSSHARADGSLPLSVVGDIWAWCNSQLRHGGPQEVEIGVILTPKASTPPAGSASPSTAEPTPEGNGVAGSYDMAVVLITAQEEQR